MPPWIYIWIARLLSGERLEKASPDESRFLAALFVVIPVYFSLMVWLIASKTLQNYLSAWWAWLVFTSLLCGIFFSAVLWSKYIHKRASYWIGTVFWALAYWVSWRLLVPK
jgi:hypothetical protein